MSFLRFAPLAAFCCAVLAGAQAQVPAGSALPPTAPTNATAPMAAMSTPADRAGAHRHRAQVNCTGGQLEVRADNSSLNGILRAVAQCTGMKITGGVTDQRVYGNYGPAAPATVLSTLLDGTQTNVLLKETAKDQPANLILTPRTGGPMPPSPSQTPDEDTDEADAGAVAGNGDLRPVSTSGVQNLPSAQGLVGSAIQHSSPGLANAPGVVSGPVSIPQPINNVMGSPGNTSLNAATYPTTHSVPLDSLPTPSTTPYQTGIVSSPNPPPAGSDTAALLNGRTTNVPGNIRITDQPTTGALPVGTTTQPAGSNSSLGTLSTKGFDGTAPPSQSLTPQQVFQQLQQLRQQQQQQQPQSDNVSPQPGNASYPSVPTTSSTPQP